MDEVFIGTIMGFGFDFAPVGWLPCQGQILPIQDPYEALFALIGNQFGGDGRNNFAVPDLRGRVPMGYGSAPGITPKVIGQMMGYEQVTLTANEMPVHTHTGTVDNLQANIMCASGLANTDNPVGNSIAKQERVDRYSTAASDQDMKEGSVYINGSMTVGHAGGGQPHYNVQPSIVVNYCIAYQGLFPPRS